MVLNSNNVLQVMVVLPDRFPGKGRKYVMHAVWSKQFLCFIFSIREPLC